MDQFLDRLHAGARRNPVFQRLAIISRILLALAFIPASIVKILGHRFTSISVDDPIGFFFEAMYRTGGYWHFIGIAQFTAGVLLLIPATTTLGAVLFFPIVLSIFIITVSLHFTGTPFITGGMLLANAFLLCWDYDRLKGILPIGPRRAHDSSPSDWSRLEWSGYLLGTAAGLAVLGWTRQFVSTPVMKGALLVGVIGAVLVIAAWVRELRRPVADRA